MKQVYRGQSLELDECYARYLLATAPQGLHQNKQTNLRNFGAKILEEI